MKQNQFEFKLFDEVFVRNNNTQNWKISLFSHINYNDPIRPFQCINGSWAECIPYNENTVHLLDTSLPYGKLAKEPKEYHVWTSGTFNQWFTKTEFENFIKTAVINNKDIKDFHVLYVKHND